MSILLILIPVALVLSLVGLGCFFWTLKNKQYDDIEGSASRILFEDEVPEEK